MNYQQSLYKIVEPIKLNTIKGNSVITAKLIASIFSAIPGPDLPVIPSEPPYAAPNAIVTAAISSSVWIAATSNCFSAARVWRTSLAGVMGYPQYTIGSSIFSAAANKP